MTQKMGISPQRNVPGLHVLRMMGTEMPFEVRNGSRVDGSHTIGTIRDGEMCRAAGYRAGDGDYRIGGQQASLWELGEIDMGVAVSGMSLSQALAVSGLSGFAISHASSMVSTWLCLWTLSYIQWMYLGILSIGCHQHICNAGSMPDVEVITVRMVS
jgi:hypothetical protein